jgi:hypothetical protein
LRFGVDREDTFYERIDVPTFDTKAEFNMGTSVTEFYFKRVLNLFLLAGFAGTTQTLIFGSSLKVLTKLMTYCLTFLADKA